MNNKILLSINTLFSVIIITFLTVNYFTSSEKLAYVDSAKLIENYEGMKIAKEAYRENLSSWQANIDTLTNEVQESLKKFEKERASMTEKELALSKELLRNKQQKLVDYQKAIQEKARQEDARLTQDVVVTINAYLKNYGKQHQYNIIFGATELGNIVYADNAIDLTDKVLSGLNAQYNR